jgi:hypothetical protein
LPMASVEGPLRLPAIAFQDHYRRIPPSCVIYISQRHAG